MRSVLLFDIGEDAHGIGADAAAVAQERPGRAFDEPFIGDVSEDESLDADEALDDLLKASIAAAKMDFKKDGYYMNRLTNYCGSWIRHGGWYPDRKLRLWDSRQGQWTGIDPHDRFEMRTGSRIEHLEGDILHYSYYSLSDHHKQVEYFTTIAAASAAAIARWAAAGARVVVYEAALLVENRAHAGLAGLIVVALPPELQLARLMARDRLSLDDARARVAAQAPLAAKLAAATWVIDNAGDLAALAREVDRVVADVEARLGPIRAPAPAAPPPDEPRER